MKNLDSALPHPRDFAPRYAAPLRNHKVPRALYFHLAQEPSRPSRYTRCIVRGAAFTATKLHGGLSDHVKACARHSRPRGTLYWRRIRAGFWSHRDDLYLRSTCKKTMHHLAAKRDRETEKESEVENDAFAASLAATSLAASFYSRSRVHKATSEVARNQQPSLSRWQIVESPESSFLRTYYVCPYRRLVSHFRARCVCSFLFFPLPPLSLSHSLIRASDFFFALVRYNACIIAGGCPACEAQLRACTFRCPSRGDVRA